MGTIKAKLAEWAKDQRLMRFTAIAGTALLVLLAGLCISIHMRANIQGDIHLRAQIQEQTYQNLVGMAELFSRVDDPNVDVQHKLIPSLKAQYAAVSALNTALVDGFGKRSAVLSPEQIAEFDAAFEEYANAYRSGMATGLARDDMAACIAGVQSMIDERYKPKTESTDEAVLVIGATQAPAK